ncbi:Suppressor of the cold-sensitive snRNP bioproteinsis mutant brr1-1 [Perkinsus olseni]|uniref:subtilisin n=1 Tax=Perkinsus olseni TaxID=32597 RepID=A0A7J6U5J4_PEROL|nr:Suppressor of the cold-sensitive snRNP bioproteinsis mutant brr1-1 [Perkinsus olseni]KAF4752984.1 Suppressor of the cold-sensitive snRNP bioproteinsis mutant brr1-1 [Perkinsus olseni]
MLATRLDGGRRLSPCERKVVDCLSNEPAVDKMLTLGVQVIDTGSILCNVTRQEMCQYLSFAAETLEVEVLCDPNVEFEPVTGYTGTEKKNQSKTTTATTPTPTGPTLSKLGVNDRLSDRQWNLEAIGMKQAWRESKRARRLKKVVVPSLTRVLTTSMTTCGKIFSLLPQGVRGYNFHDNNNDTSDVLLDDHGTFVAGIIGATTNNSIGIAGIADVKMMPIKVTNSEGSAPLAELAKGLNYVLDNGAKVSCIAFASSGPSPVLEKAIERAAQLGHLVTAAGNGGRGITQRKRFPCAYTERLDMLCVAGSDERGRLAHGSNFTSHVDIAAPGTRIWSTGIHNKYFRDGGTSAATAHVAGVASLLYAIGHPLRRLQARW